MISPDKSTDNLYGSINITNQINEQESIIDFISTRVHSESIINSESNPIKVLTKRWIVLAVFSLVTLVSAFNWIEYNIIQGSSLFIYFKYLNKLKYGILKCGFRCDNSFLQ